MLPGAFHALLQNMAVSAFDHATPHRQPCLAEGGVLHPLRIVERSRSAAGETTGYSPPREEVTGGVE